MLTGIGSVRRRALVSPSLLAKPGLRPRSGWAAQDEQVLAHRTAMFLASHDGLGVRHPEPVGRSLSVEIGARMTVALRRVKHKAVSFMHLSREGEPATRAQRPRRRRENPRQAAQIDQNVRADREIDG